MPEPWTIPFDNTNYVCWRDSKNSPHSRAMTPDEERVYFTTPDKQKYLNELLRN